MAPGATNMLDLHAGSVACTSCRVTGRSRALGRISGVAAEKGKQMLDALGFKAFNGGGYKDILKIVGK